MVSGFYSRLQINGTVHKTHFKTEFYCSSLPKHVYNKVIGNIKFFSGFKLISHEHCAYSVIPESRNGDWSTETCSSN